jgi:high-affinity nickel-transport protein
MRETSLPSPAPARLRLWPLLAALYALLFMANVGAWGAALLLFHGQPVLMGTATLAYVFGLRHAFDADHIAAIDNVVRKLVQEGRKSVGVGLFFSLGHSTIVVMASAAIAASASALQGGLGAYHAFGGLVGTLVSALFLLAIGIANLLLLRGIWTAFQRARRGEDSADADIEGMLTAGGPLARLFRPVFRVVKRSWHMYLIGFLFGLGFDTATEIGLLAISATQAAAGMNIWEIMVFPALFTAGMALMDTSDSIAMVGVYGWAFVNPVRKLWYNFTITAASVVVAIFIGGVEVLGLFGSRLNLAGGFWDLIGALNGNFGAFGYAVAGIFLASWLISTLVYRLKRYDVVSAETT